jgi:hypothetical protein
MEAIYLQGRTITADQLSWIQSLRSTHPQWGRYQLSLHIAEQWQWRNAAGQLKDMAARTLLSKLERRALLQLPPRQRGGGSRKALPPSSPPRLAGLGPALLRATLSELAPLQLVRAESGPPHQMLRQLLQQHHYLGYQRPVGENLQYLALDGQERPLAGLVFGAAAWQCAPRDQFIGWTATARQQHLSLLANHMRFLILPWVQVPQLGSYLLGRAARQLSADWQRKYGHGIYLLETFVQKDRFAGTCYRAANWQWVGQTQGRSRNDRKRTLQVPSKDIYVYALHPKFRTRLGGASP